MVASRSVSFCFLDNVCSLILASSIFFRNSICSRSFSAYNRSKSHNQWMIDSLCKRNASFTSSLEQLLEQYWNSSRKAQSSLKLIVNFKLNKSVSREERSSPSPTRFSDCTYTHMSKMPPHTPCTNWTYRSPISSQQMMRCCHHQHRQTTNNKKEQSILLVWRSQTNYFLFLGQTTDIVG